MNSSHSHPPKQQTEQSRSGTCHAKFDRGKSRTNRDEARAIVADAVGTNEALDEVAEEQRLTLGVITFNIQQQVLIQGPV